MKRHIATCIPTLVCLALLAACGGNSSDPAAPNQPPTTGTITVSITDDPWHEPQSMVLTITAMEFGHAGGDVVHVDIPGGPLSMDMVQLQNGVSRQLMADVEMPAGRYEWMRLQLDLDQSYMDMRDTGGRYRLQMGPNDPDGLESHEAFEIQQGFHSELMLDFDLRQGVEHHQMGMMGDQYELHSALRLVHMENAGAVSGTVGMNMTNLEHPDCDPVNGSNWVYVFPGDAAAPDDIADPETDGVPGPIATDHVEMEPGSGDYRYHLAYLPQGSYRIAFTCAGEWDEVGDDDYPADPDGRFDFQAFSDPIEIQAGQMHNFDF